MHFYHVCVLCIQKKKKWNLLVKVVWNPFQHWSPILRFNHLPSELSVFAFPHSVTLCIFRRCFLVSPSKPLSPSASFGAGAILPDGMNNQLPEPAPSSVVLNWLVGRQGHSSVEQSFHWPPGWRSSWHTSRFERRHSMHNHASQNQCHSVDLLCSI